MYKNLIPFLIFFVLSCTNQDDNMNPFLSEYVTPFQIPPFEKIEFKHYEPAFSIGMKEQQDEINDIASNASEPTFANTIEALERSGNTLDKVSNVFFNLVGSNTNDDMDALAVKISPQLSSHNDKILLNKSLFSRIEILENKKSSLDLSTEQSRLLDQSQQNNRAAKRAKIRIGKLRHDALPKAVKRPGLVEKITIAIGH